MRWLWIDRFIEFESGKRARTIKNVSLAEEQLSDHFPGAPMLPNSLVIEGFAQTGGLLVGQTTDFVHIVVLAKISRAVFHRSAVPGDLLTYCTEMVDLNDSGAVVKATSHIGESPQAEADLVFARPTGRHVDRELFDRVKFITTLRITGLFDVGRNADGTPIAVPPHLLEAERTFNGEA
jgi:3-hydroxyacyl-[acyl-carrier-protein] dehydratase